MKLVSTFSSGLHEPGGFQDVEVLRDRLAGEAQAMIHRQSCAQLEQGLAIPLVQFVQNGPPCRCAEGFEDIGHGMTIGKSRLACQDGPGWLPVFEAGFPSSDHHSRVGNSSVSTGNSSVDSPGPCPAYSAVSAGAEDVARFLGMA